MLFRAFLEILFIWLELAVRQQRRLTERFRRRFVS